MARRKLIVFCYVPQFFTIVNMRSDSIRYFFFCGGSGRPERNFSNRSSLEACSFRNFSVKCLIEGCVVHGASPPCCCSCELDLLELVGGSSTMIKQIEAAGARSDVGAPPSFAENMPAIRAMCQHPLPTANLADLKIFLRLRWMAGKQEPEM